MNRRKSTEKTRKVTPPSPTYMNNDQFASYLADLRNNRIARPGGARPLPTTTARHREKRSTDRHDVNVLASSPPTSISQPPQSGRETPDTARTAPASASSRLSMSSTRAQDVQSARSRSPLGSSDLASRARYIERGQRWMEKEEAGSLRHAMDDMQLADRQNTCDDNNEGRLYDAALEEASELVWQHRHGVEPQPNAPYRYKPHMRKNSYQHARNASFGRASGGAAVASPAGDADSTNRASIDISAHSRSSRFSLDNSNGLSMNCSAKSYLRTNAHDLHVQRAVPPPSVALGNRRSSMKRNISGEVERPFSGDQIWEEPDGASTIVTDARVSRVTSKFPLATTARDPENRSQFVAALPDKQLGMQKLRDSNDVSRDSPSQSRNPQYTTNIPVINLPGDDQETCRGSGVERRGDDIREATTMRLKDRSAKLPTPSAVSDNPGRPIVSFDADWKAPEKTTDNKPGPACGSSSSQGRHQSHTSVAIPTIVVPDQDDAQLEVSQRPPSPPIVVQDTSEAASTSSSIPCIVTPEDDHVARPSPRPLPTPGMQKGRSAPVMRPRGHWSAAPAAAHRSSTSCHECSLPIEGRFVALAGVPERFHPQCFRCYSCGTGLEALEISPEPELHRANRLSRIRRRLEGEIFDESPGMTMEDDGDERFRFFCHLDWHELYAPRCKHCKTPILGEHIVALGEHWHYGHFFCAECGDPFNQGMTHIEKDGYAWCINCQTKRTERRAPKCKKCRRAVIGQYIQALGGEWHDECFRCAACHGGFDDGQVFPQVDGDRTLVLCTGCRARQLKA